MVGKGLRPRLGVNDHGAGSGLMTLCDGSDIGRVLPVEVDGL